MLAVIAAVSRAFEGQRQVAVLVDQSRVAAIQQVARILTQHYQAEIQQLERRIQARLLHVEPFHQRWNVFRMFDLEYDETRWTQWLASTMRRENGERCARAMWSALCEAIARRAAANPPSGPPRLAQADHWQMLVSEELPVVQDEVPHPVHGRLDILITSPQIVVALENKIRAGWHDGPDRKQADRYRDFAMELLPSDERCRLGLVVLSHRDLTPADYPADYVYLPWRDLGRAIRRVIRHEWKLEPSAQEVVAFWPLVIMLVSIEQDLMKLTLDRDAQRSDLAYLQQLSALASYLDEE